MTDPSPDTKPLPLTFGQRAVGLDFNPSDSTDVHKVKQAFADVIDNLHALRLSASAAGNPETIRLACVAITETQTAQMWAVKAITNPW